MYEGEFKNGRFHGKGTLNLKDGGSFEARWHHGEIVEGSYTFADGLEYKPHEWAYCTLEDRRFHSEMQRGVRPAGDTQATNDTVPKRLLRGCFDVGTGFYDPTDNTVYDFETRQPAYEPTEKEAEWIKAKCRVGR